MGDKRRAPHRDDHLLTFALEHPWAITRPMLSIVAGILGRHLAGETRADEAQIVPRERAQAVVRPEGRGVAVIPVHGVLAPRVNLLSEFSGGATFESLGEQLATAVAAPEVGTIVLDIDSPGGTASGATEFARQVLAARAKKPVIAQAQFTMCSAAYWIGACATEVVAAPSAHVGSIGVYTIHNDLSEALAQVGVKRTYIAAGKFKVDGNETEPLSAETRARLQAMVDEAYALFVADVARGRGVTPAAVRGGFGLGGVVTAAQAQDLGLVDRVATLDETIDRVLGVSPGSTRPAAAKEPSQEPPKATDAQIAARRAYVREQERVLRELAF